MEQVNEKVVDLTPNQEKPVVQTRSQKNKNKKNGKKKKSSFLSNLILLIGIAGMLVGGYILGSTLLNEYQRGKLTKEYLEEVKELTSADNYISRDAFNPQPRERVGMIEIPSQNMKTPIVEGTNFDDLYASAGHLENSHWPGDQKQVFLSGHRNTEFGVLQNMKLGDEIIVKMAYGEFKYRVTDFEAAGTENGIKIVNQNDYQVIDTVGDYENDQLVLMTCYPFTFGADTEERYLVYAERAIE